MPYGEFGALSPDARLDRLHAAARATSAPGSATAAAGRRISGSTTCGRTARERSRHPTPTTPSPCGTARRSTSSRTAAPRSATTCGRTTAAPSSVRQVTHFTDHDVRFPAIGPSDIVFENGGRLYLLDLATEQTREVKVQVTTDLAYARPRVETRRLGHPELRHLAHRQARGLRRAGRHLHRAGRARRAAEPDGAVRERGALPGVVAGRAGRRVLERPHGRVRADDHGRRTARARSARSRGSGPGSATQPYWSPDAKTIVFIDQAMRIHLLDVASGESRVIDQANYYTTAHWDFRVSWSADSRWFAYSRDQPSRSRPCSSTTRSATSCTRSRADSTRDQPVFDPEGKYLYFLTQRHFQPSTARWTTPGSTRTRR